MKPSNRSELETNVIRGYREFSISMVLFRNQIAAKLGLNITDMECLDVLFFKGISSPTELAKHLGITSGSMTTMLDRLERSGLIKRQSNPHDRRGKQIILNEKAIKKVGLMFAPLRQSQAKLLASYSEQELILLSNYFLSSKRIWEDGLLKLKRD
jgi:DNA-binding MarR family transcriptional regulator